MANSKSALKNIRKNKARYLRNRTVTSRLKTLEKAFVTAIENKNQDEAKSAATVFLSALDKASKSNLVHQNKVSRKKSRCAGLLKSL